MSKLVCSLLLVLLLFFCLPLQGQTTWEDCNVLKIYDGWRLSAPKDFRCEGYFHIDSYVGNISSKEDSIQLHIDVMPFGSNKDDCSLEWQTKLAKSFLGSERTKQLYDVPTTNRIYIDTINGRIATIVVPQKIGKGKTLIHIKDCPSDSHLFIDAKDLNENQQRLVLRIFQTINYTKAEDIK